MSLSKPGSVFLHEAYEMEEDAVAYRLVVRCADGALSVAIGRCPHPKLPLSTTRREMCTSLIRSLTLHLAELDLTE